MGRRYKTVIDMYNSKSRDRKRRGAAPGCMTIVLGAMVLVTSILFLVF